MKNQIMSARVLAAIAASKLSGQYRKQYGKAKGGGHGEGFTKKLRVKRDVGTPLGNWFRPGMIALKANTPPMSGNWHCEMRGKICGNRGGRRFGRVP